MQKKNEYKKRISNDVRFLFAEEAQALVVEALMSGETWNKTAAKLADRAEGVNAPVMHPRCRCTTTFDMNYVQRRARDPLTGRNSIIDGNVTYSQWKESLTAEQKSALELTRKKNRNRARDKLQYIQYQQVIGRKNAPKSFDKFQELKYNDNEEWHLLKDYKKSRVKNAISAFTSFDDYKTYHRRIETEIIGLITVDGVKVEVQSKHFIERIFGTTEDPLTHKPRSGVEIEDVKEALLNGTTHHRKDSLRYFGMNCAVSVNKNSGTLIQTNPKGKGKYL